VCAVSNVITKAARKIPFIQLEFGILPFDLVGFRRKIKYYLVHRLGYTNKEAQHLLQSGSVEIGGRQVSGNESFSETDSIRIAGEDVKSRKQFSYIKFYKPRGYESTLHPSAENGIGKYFANHSGLSIAGRLDKDSEGLLLLSDDGKWVERTINPKYEKEKEYLVTLDRDVTERFLLAFSSGVSIGAYTTLPCVCVKAGDNSIKVILREGKNRQIRRMCLALGYRVRSLLRTRIGNIHLHPLQKGETLMFDPDLEKESSANEADRNLKG
jgi:23S rRNA pseudouridine2604 synthase